MFCCRVGGGDGGGREATRTMHDVHYICTVYTPTRQQKPREVASETHDVGEQRDGQDMSTLRVHFTARSVSRHLLRPRRCVWDHRNGVHRIVISVSVPMFRFPACAAVMYHVSSTVPYRIDPPPPLPASVSCCLENRDKESSIEPQYIFIYAIKA